MQTAAVSPNIVRTPKPQATTAPTDAAFAGLTLDVTGGFTGLHRILTVRPDFSWTNTVVGAAQPSVGSLDAAAGADLVSRLARLAASDTPAEQFTSDLADAPRMKLAVQWEGTEHTWQTDGVHVTPETRSVLDALQRLR